MKVRSWHMGKVIMLWSWGIAGMVVDLYVLKEHQEALTKHVLLGFFLLILLLVVPLVLSVLTWHWLGGKEAAGNAAAAGKGRKES